MLEKERLVKQIAKRKGIDPRVVRLVADYPFRFVRDRMKDNEDWRPIRIRYFGIFALRPKFRRMLLNDENVVDEK